MLNDKLFERLIISHVWLLDNIVDRKRTNVTDLEDMKIALNPPVDLRAERFF